MRVEAAWVRAGYGWNTIMVKVSSDCAATFGAWLDGSWPDEDVPPWPDGVRVQASRPPGDVRTGPEPWVVLSPSIGPLPFLEWTASQLAGYLRYRVAGWGAVSDSVRLRARTEGADDELVLRAGAPSAPTDTLVQVEFPRLRKAGLKAGTSRIELRWPDEKLEMELDVPAHNVLAAFHGPILMLGWGPGPDDPGPAPGDAAGLPLAGRNLRGSWVVPDALDGFSLDLDVEQAPGSYRLELEDLETTGGSAVLCAPCSKGTRLDLFVTVSADWTEWPAALVTDHGFADTDADPASAAQWLSLLDDKGSKNYRERGLEASN